MTFKKGNIPWMSGRKHSQKTKDKMKKAQTGKNHYNWKGGEKYDKDGYVQIYKPNHPFCGIYNYVFKHRLVAEKCLRRYLTKIEVIHHINGIKDDNRPKNLYLFKANGEHTGYHHLKNKSVLKSNL